jgi:ribonuclease P protein component
VIAKTGRFRRADRILHSRDFKQTLKSGKRRTSRAFVVVIAAGSLDRSSKLVPGRSRLGVTVSKQVGNSVVRNRVKRRIREWFRQRRNQLPRSSDIVVIARQTARELSGNQIASILDETLGQPPVCEDGRAAARLA